MRHHITAVVVSVASTLVVGLTLVAEDRFTVKSPNGIAFSEFKGYDARLAAEARAERSASALKVEQALPLTCLQAWIASSQSYPQMLTLVTTFAKISLANRDLKFPETRAAGLDAGKGIADDCKADPNALLFAIVDKHVRRVAQVRR